ncbi:MAG: hypothetical protein GX585_05795, partial [Clostridiales bacterium]|nr:hypothetical protein [Clostridiales bacterium]
TKLATARTIGISGGATGTATSFDGTGNITIPVTALDASKATAGVLPAARLSGTYNIGISGKAATAGAADTAVTATNVNGGSVNATTGTFSGTVTSSGNMVTKGGSFSLHAPNTAGDWARGLYFRSTDGNTAYGGIGMHGTGTGDSTTLNSIYLGFGDNPHATTNGILIGKNGTTTVRANLTATGSFTGTTGSFTGAVSTGALTAASLNTGVGNITTTGTVSGGTGTFTGGVSAAGGFTGNLTGNVTGNVSGNAGTATKLATARTIGISGGATGTATSFNGTGNVTIPVTALDASKATAGILPAARLSGTYGIAISGNAATATKLATARTINGVSFNGTANITVADSTKLPLAGGTLTGAVTMNGAARMNNNLTIFGDNADREIVFDGVSSTVAKWRLLHSASGSGDANYFRLQSTGSAGSTYADVVRFGMDTKDAVFSGNISPAATNTKTLGTSALKWGNVYATTLTGNLAGNVTGNVTGNLAGNVTGNVSGNAGTATKLATARTIGMSGGATGTATSFDGTGNITIPVTALDASKATAGILPAARLSGTYGIGISGNAATATKLGTARTIAISGAATGTATSFNGAGNITIPVTALDASGGKLTAVQGGAKTSYSLASYSSSSNAATGIIKVTLPFGWNTTMMNVELDVYEYDSNGASKIIIGGYTYGGGSYWVNTSYSVTGNYNKGVRLAYDGTNVCILLGTPSTVWSYPKVFLSRISGNTTTYTTAASISLITDESTLTAINTPAMASGTFAGVKANTLDSSGAASIAVTKPLSVTGAVTASGGFSGNLTGNVTGNVSGNAATATKLATARTIAISGGATGTATSFNGAANITIPVTALDASKATAGILPAARLSGTYGIAISGNAATATKLATARTIAISGGATGT